MSTPAFFLLFSLLVLLAESKPTNDNGTPSCEAGWTLIKRRAAAYNLMTPYWCLRAMVADGKETKWDLKDAENACKQVGGVLSVPEVAADFNETTSSLPSTSRLVLYTDGFLNEKCIDKESLNDYWCTGFFSHFFLEKHSHTGRMVSNWVPEKLDLMRHDPTLPRCIGLIYSDDEKNFGKTVPLHCEKSAGSFYGNGALCGRLPSYN